MALIPSLQMLDEQVTYIDDQQSMYDPSILAGIKSEPDRDHTSCSELMASSLPSFSHTFFGSSYPTVEDPDMLQSWTAKHPDHWTTKEVLDWVFYVVQRHNLDASMIPGENFQNVSGIELCRMRREEFIARDPNFGAYIYEVLQELLQGATFAEPECDTSPNSDNFPMVGAPSFMEDTFTDISNQTCTQEEGIMVLIGPDLYDIDINKPFDLPGIDGTAEVPDPGYYSESGSDLDRDSDSVLTDSMETDPFSSDMYSLSCFPSKSRYHTESLSSICSDSSEDADLAFQTPPPKPKNNRGRPAGQASKGNHLWEFIRDTLKDSKFNPALLKWENKAEGVFRFVQSEAVAQMWGRKKNNPGMTYEKLSRAMRYYYQRGILDRVEGKRLVYKFGKNSHGWQN